MKKTLIIITLTLSVVLFSTNSFAVQAGPYFEVGTGSGEAEYKDDESFDIHTNYMGGGFQVETNPLSERGVFSYRFQIGYESRNMWDSNDVVDLDGFLINNTFSFGKTIADNVRIWAGPQISLGYYGGKTRNEIQGDPISFKGIGFGLGPAVGTNHSFGNVILSTTLGIRTFGFSGTVKCHNESYDIRGNTTEVFATFAIMF